MGPCVCVCVCAYLGVEAVKWSQEAKEDSSVLSWDQVHACVCVCMSVHLSGFKPEVESGGKGGAKCPYMVSWVCMCVNGKGDL